MTVSDASVLVGVDDSPASIKAVHYAAREASLRDIPLEIVHSSHYLYVPSRYTGVSSETVHELNDYSRRCLAVAEAAARDAQPTVEVSSTLHEGDPIEYLLGRSRTAPVIVLGTHHTGNLRAAILRSIGQSVAAHAHCPVILVGDDPQPNAPRRARVVVGVSASPGGKAALRFAAEEARRRGASVWAVRCWGDVDWGAASLGYSAGMFADWEHNEQQVLSSCLEEIIAEFPNLRAEGKLMNLRASWALQQEALGSELLVVGAHRQDDHWFSRLGPVASWLLHRSPCPIAVVGRPVAEQATGGEAQTGQQAVGR